MVVYPEAVWYGNVQPEDAAAIVEEHLVGGRPVERLRIADDCINTKAARTARHEAGEASGADLHDSHMACNIQTTPRALF